MVRKDAMLTLYVLAPLPILAITIYVVNTIIYKKSEKIQSLLSDLTTNAQESYSGIRVIKSLCRKKPCYVFLTKNSEEYKQNAIGLAKVESIYFPKHGVDDRIKHTYYHFYWRHPGFARSIKVGVIVEFVIYINMLTFPVSAIGWVASMIQRASASQKRLKRVFTHRTRYYKMRLKNLHLVKGDIVF